MNVIVLKAFRARFSVLEFTFWRVLLLFFLLALMFWTRFCRGAIMLGFSLLASLSTSSSSFLSRECTAEVPLDGILFDISSSLLAWRMLESPSRVVEIVLLESSAIGMGRYLPSRRFQTGEQLSSVVASNEILPSGYIFKLSFDVRVFRLSSSIYLQPSNTSFSSSLSVCFDAFS